MKIAIVEAFSGASGDMFLGAFTGISITEKDLQKIISSLDLSLSLEIRKVRKKGILAPQIIVKEKEKKERTFDEVVDIISDSGFEKSVKNDAISVFKILWDAEKKVHGSNTVFHEVGSDDAILDILGSSLAFNRIRNEGISRIFRLPVSVGKGIVQTSHGTYPVPPPAVMEILSRYSIPFHYGPVEGELLTPTGAAILAHFTEDLPENPVLNIEKVAYGAGQLEIDFPNVLRISLGYMAETDSDTVRIIETNVDDVTGEEIGNLISIMSEIAHDISVIPLITKKNRPGYLIRVLTSPEKEHEVCERLILETGTLGVRVLPLQHRYKIKRYVQDVTVSIKGENFDAKVKISEISGIKRFSCEYDDAMKISNITGLPLREIMRIVEEEARRLYGNKN